MSHPATGDDFDALERRLAEERPLPAPGFRAQLRRDLVESGSSAPSPRRLRLQIACLAATGAFLVGIAAAGLVDVGPFDSPQNPLLDGDQPTSSATE